MAWLNDSGATHHMTPFASHFVSLRPSRVQIIYLADNSTVPVLGEGTVAMMGPQGRVLINDVLFVPNLSHALLSVAAVFDKGGHVAFQKRAVNIYAAGHASPVLHGPRRGNAWYVEG